MNRDTNNNNTNIQNTNKENSNNQTKQSKEEKKKLRTQQVRRQRIILGAAAVLIVLLGVVLIHNFRSSGTEETAEGINASSVTAAAEQSSDSSAVTSSQDASADAGETEAALEQTAVTASAAYAPEAEDGSGAAGLLPMDEYMTSLCTAPGLVSDGQNAWYTPDMVNCYYSGWFTASEGVTYHLDSSGLVDYGWKLIGGQGYYFDDNGIYQPDADPNKLLAFTFDDGPSQGMDELLELCEETGARVTFFMIGRQVENGGAVLPHIIQDRCEVGNHSYTHTQMTTLSTEECVSNFNTCDEWIKSYSGGTESDVVRFPYGDYTAEQAAAVGKASIMWSVDSLDWDYLETQPVIDKVLSEITEGDIILMHDRHETTVEACRYLFPYLISQGYQLVTVKELAAAKGYELEAGKTYYGFCNEYIEEGRVYQ